MNRTIIVAIIPLILFWMGAAQSKVLLAPEPTTLNQAKAQALTPAPANAPLIQKREITLTQMGRPKGYQLTGIFTKANLNSGVRLDELILDAKFRMKIAYPPGLTYDASYIRIMVNGQLAGVHQLDETKAGVYHTVELPLVASLFSDFAEMEIEFLGSPAHLGELTCWSPSHPALRLDISPESALVLTTKPLAVVNDLALLPAPFFDPRDQRKLNLPVVLPEGDKSLNVLRAAGVMSSWFGAQASYRQASFEVVQDIPEDRHTVILSLGDRLPEFLDTASIKGPTLAISGNPNLPHIKRLWVIGRNEDELMQAVQGLVLEGQVLSGQTALIEEVKQAAPRKAYDAPRYVPTDRPVRFAELMDYPTQLEITAANPEALLNLRLPPDLFSWAGKNIDMSLKYRYTAPSDWNDSLLTVEINNNLLQSLRLPPRQEQSQSRFNLNLLGQSDMSNEEALQIPAFRVGGNNQLRFLFYFAEEGQRSCNGQPLMARGSVDPESVLDFSDLPHYIRMPDLASFANGGYPFSIYADMSQTAIVLPEEPNTQEIGSLLNLTGLLGQWTGLPATRITLARPGNEADLAGKDWISIGTVERSGWLQKYKMDMPMVLEETRRSLGQSEAARMMDEMWSLHREDLTPTEEGRALVQSTGSLGSIMSFESPITPKRAAVVVTGTDPLSLSRAMEALSDYGDIGQIRGSVTLLRGESIQSYRVGDSYIAGSLPWYMRIRIAFAEYPALIALTGVLAGVILAIVLFGWLSGRAARKNRDA